MEINRERTNQIYMGIAFIISGIVLNNYFIDTRWSLFGINVLIIVGVGSIAYVFTELIISRYKENKINKIVEKKKEDKPIYIGESKNRGSMLLVKYMYVYLQKENGQWKTMGKVAGRKGGVYLVGKDTLEWSDYIKAREECGLKWAKMLNVPFKEK